MLNLLPMFGLHTVNSGVPLFLVGFSFSSRVEQHQEGWARSAGSGEWGTFDSEMDWWKTSLSPSCKRDTVRKPSLILLLSFNVEQVTSLHYIFSALMKICCIICLFQGLLKAMDSYLSVVNQVPTLAPPSRPSAVLRHQELLWDQHWSPRPPPHCCQRSTVWASAGCRPPARCALWAPPLWKVGVPVCRERFRSRNLPLRSCSLQGKSRPEGHFRHKKLHQSTIMSPVSPLRMFSLTLSGT